VLIAFFLLVLLLIQIGVSINTYVTEVTPTFSLAPYYKLNEKPWDALQNGQLLALLATNATTFILAMVWLFLFVGAAHRAVLAMAKTHSYCSGFSDGFNFYDPVNLVPLGIVDFVEPFVVAKVQFFVVASIVQVVRSFIESPTSATSLGLGLDEVLDNGDKAVRGAYALLQASIESDIAQIDPANKQNQSLTQSAQADIRNRVYG
jgi:hypothetical protein